MTGFICEYSSSFSQCSAPKKRKEDPMKTLLFTILTICVLLSGYGTTVRAPGDQNAPSALSKSMATVHSQPGCQAFQAQLATLQHLLRVSRAYIGDAILDRSEAAALAAARGKLQSRIDQVQAESKGCLDPQAFIVPQSQCQVFQDQLASLRHLVRVSRAYLGDDILDQSELKALMVTRKILQGRIDQVQAKLNGCPSSQPAMA
jgi:hypothetical protein